MRQRPQLPQGHGELLVRPPFTDWATLIETNRAGRSDWDFTVGGLGVGEMVGRARQEVIAAGAGFSARMGVQIREPRRAADPLVMTGHQPELYHAGVWVKDFLLQRISEEADATAIDIVVDSDGFDIVSVTAPCMRPETRRCAQHLAVGSEGGCYACASVPSAHDIEQFCTAGDEMLSTLPAPSIRRHFGEFCEGLREAVVSAENLSEVVTFARRRYEAAAGSDYLELPVTTMSRTSSFSRFVVHLAHDARRFAEDYNSELGEYRTATRTRSSAQPFPDLAIEQDAVELPVWALWNRRRETVWAQQAGDSVRLVAGGEELAELPADFDLAEARVASLSAVLAPKALALTLFLRTFCCDLFIHGVGGGRYDRVTDGVMRRHFGIEPPAFAVASMTMYLPLGAHVVTEEEVSAARERLNRLEHNPNELLGEVEFEDPSERVQATQLAEEKAELVRAIGKPDADKKALGARIREVNRALTEVLAPVRAELEAELAGLEAQRDASDILTDRTYPFCYWSPLEIADHVR